MQQQRCDMITNISELSDRFHLNDIIANVDYMPSTHLMKKIIEDYEESHPITKKIKYIPHIKLKVPEFDLDRALNEINEFYIHDDFGRLNLAGIPESQGGSYYHYKGLHPSWGTRALINYTPSSTGTWGKEDREIAVRDFPSLQQNALHVKGRKLLLSDMLFYKTDIWDKLPYITSYITENICSAENLKRSHVYRLKANGILNFHNHRLLPWEDCAAPFDEGIVHIPLITNTSSKMCVQINDTTDIDVQHYAAGECWLLNSYLNHAVDCTETTIDRVHLTIMCDFSDKTFVELIERSI